MSQRIYTKLVKRNLKLIRSINNNIQLFSDSAQSKLAYEYSFVGIPEVLRRHGFLNINFKIEILANFEFFGGSNLSTTGL